MGTIYKNGNVRARCPDCDGSLTTFENKVRGQELGAVTIGGHHPFHGRGYNRIIYQLVKCAGCGRGGLAKIHCNDIVSLGILEEFYPISIEHAKLPDNIPEGIGREYREAEFCASFAAWRAASALLRSTLEKTLKINGYTKGVLENKIDAAADDGIITEARRKKAHDDIRVLGNDVLHDEWREVTENEVTASHHYTQRILEDFYDDRQSVENILKSKKRIKI